MVESMLVKNKIDGQFSWLTCMHKLPISAPSILHHGASFIQYYKQLKSTPYSIVHLDGTRARASMCVSINSRTFPPLKIFEGDVLTITQFRLLSCTHHLQLLICIVHKKQITHTHTPVSNSMYIHNTLITLSEDVL